MNATLQARPLKIRNLAEFLTLEFEAAEREHQRQQNLLKIMEQGFEDGKLSFTSQEFSLQEAQCRQQRMIVENSKAGRDSARASLDAELARLATEKLKEDDAQEMQAIDRELKANGDELATNNQRELQLRKRDVQLHYRQTWLMKRRADLEKRSGAMPTGTQPSWYDDKYRTEAQKLAEILT